MRSHVLETAAKALVMRELSRGQEVTNIEREWPELVEGYYARNADPVYQASNALIYDAFERARVVIDTLASPDAEMLKAGIERLADAASCDCAIPSQAAMESAFKAIILKDAR